MPIDVSIDRGHNLVRRRISGEVGTDDMIGSFEDTLRDP